MKLQLNQLSSHLSNKLAPCYLVTGDEHLLVDEALDAIRAAARERGFTSREVHVASAGFDWPQLGATGANLSLFAEQRIVELRLPTGKPGRAGGQAIVDFISQLGPELMLIVSTPKLDRNNSNAKWVKALAAAGAHLTIWPIGVRELPGWLGERMRRAGLRPSREAVAMIADRVEGNLLAASQEVEKLRLLLGEGDISDADVSRAVANSSRFDVYKLADAALAGDPRRSLRILAGLREEGIEPPLVMWSLTKELRALARISDIVSVDRDLGGAMRKAGVWNSRQALVRSCIARHSRDDFYQLLKAAGRADAAAKGQGPGDAWQMAADILLRLSRAGKRAA